MPTRLYVGIDIGKRRHAGAFLSKSILMQRKSFTNAPTFPFSNDGEGFADLLTRVRKHVDPAYCRVLLERTGHYGYALEQFLIAEGFEVYRVQPKGRYGKNKTDPLDAKALAAILWNQVELRAQMPDERHRVSVLPMTTPTSRKLRGLVRRRHELQRELTRIKNKLTAISDELFPEFTKVYSNPVLESAIALRKKYPTPDAIVSASLDELCKTRAGTLPGRDALARLQELARVTVGVKDTSRIFALQIEQRQLIVEMELLKQHLEEIEEIIESVIKDSREGQILTSFIGIGATNAAVLLAGIGSIENFATSGRLKGYLGWSPRDSQTGSSYNKSGLDPSGNKLLKVTMYLSTLAAIHYDPTWHALDERLTRRMCSWDEKKKEWVGHRNVVGHVAGQLIKIMFALLKRDSDLVAQWEKLHPGEELPPPELYSVEKHVDTGGRKHQRTSASAG